MTRDWNPQLYDTRHSFVWKFGAELIGLLDPKPGEHILDIGCGTGHLTAQIAASGSRVIGIDRSEEMIGQARATHPGIEFRVGDASDFSVDAPVDAVFSNAALHWVRDAEGVARSVSRALKPGGRFVAEFGGSGNVQTVLAGVLPVLEAHGHKTENPWYFPDVPEYSALLKRHDLETRMAMLFDRPTDLEDPERGLQQWLEMFGGPFFDQIAADERAVLLGQIENRLRPALFRDGHWFVDYRRIRIVAVKL